MSHKPQLTVSGFRGIWGETLTCDIACKYSQAFLHLLKDEGCLSPVILIAYDGRESGTDIKRSLLDFFENKNVKIIDGEILPTPTVLFSVRRHKYDGAIIITASHNPIEYNGLKFVNKDAFFLTDIQIEKMKNYYGK